MTIDREDLDRSRVVLPDVTAGRRLLPVHPGELSSRPGTQSLRVPV